MSVSAVAVLDEIVDTVRYPLTELGSVEWRQLVAGIQRELRECGCSVLPGFLRPDLNERVRMEGASIAPLAYYDVETVNVYNLAADISLPADHPGRMAMRRGNAFVARDRIPADLVVHRLYASEPFRRFIASCFSLPRLHELGDPLSGLCLNVVLPGVEHPWHFDKNEFTVSLLTQEPVDGGVFEYCPNIRSAETENLPGVRRVLTGDGAAFIRRLRLRPGDLQLFRGRYSMHRVSEVCGDRARHTAIFAYSEVPGVVGGVARTRQLFGRVRPEHLLAQERGVRVDRLLD